MFDKNGNEVLASLKYGNLITKPQTILLWLSCFLGIFIFSLMMIYGALWAETSKDRIFTFLLSPVWVCVSIFFYYIILKSRKNALLIKKCLKDCVELNGTTSIIIRHWSGNVRLKLEFQYLSNIIIIESKYIRINEELLNVNINFLYSKHDNEIIFIRQSDNSNINQVF